MAPTELDAKAEVLAVPQNNTHRLWWRDPGLRRLAPHLFVLLLGSFVCGYDGSVLNAAFGIDDFLSDMNDPDSNKQGLLSAAISLGYLIGFFPSSWAGDKWGRKWPQLVGSAIVVGACFMQVFAISGWKFFGARILIGFGAAFPLTLGSTHLFELAHPRQAAEMVTLFAAFYWVGAICAAWSTFGSTYIGSNWTEEAHRILAKYHANGDVDDELVQTEMAEITTALELEKTSAFGYLDFLRTAPNRHRLFLCIWIGLIVQWVGNGIISYYLVPILQSVGITSTVQQQGLNGGLQIFNLFVSVIGVIYIQRVPRRTLWLGSTIAMLVLYSMFTAASAVFDKTGNRNAGRAAVAMIFLYNGAYDLSYSIMYYSYVLEVLPYRMRTKGMALSLAVDYGLFFNQYVNPIAFGAIGYRYYYVYIGMIFISLVVIYFTFPETQGLTLEQAAAVLDGGTKARIEEAGKEAAVAMDAKEVEVESL
ncbi:hypothetical protein B0A53_05651 [Rhodotorula sp. CCFEE 5036]|nr:hypothetical protein B0A53_05651 [Rhodotorula sp. CCFEE 5036]